MVAGGRAQYSRISANFASPAARARSLFGRVAVDGRKRALDHECNRNGEDDAGNAEHDAAGQETKNNQNRMHMRRPAENDRADDLIDRQPKQRRIGGVFEDIDDARRRA